MTSSVSREKTLISEQTQIIWIHSSPSNMETEILTQLKSCQRGVLAKRRYSLTGLWRTPWRPSSLPQEHLKMLASGECYDNCQSHTCHSLQRILTHTPRGEKKPVSTQNISHILPQFVTKVPPWPCGCRQPFPSAGTKPSSEALPPV